MDGYPAALESNVSRLQAQLSGVLNVRNVQVLEAPDRVVSFSGQLLRDESLEDTANLPDPNVLAAEIVEDLQAALEQFGEIAEDVGE